MITSVYAHILDEDRKINAQKFESAFYANPDLRSVCPRRKKGTGTRCIVDLEALVEQLRKSPELANIAGGAARQHPSANESGKNRISKDAIFISKAGKSFKSQLAGIQQK